MKLTIDISKQLYEECFNIRNNKDINISKEKQDIIKNAIGNGVPLFYLLKDIKSQILDECEQAKNSYLRYEIETLGLTDTSDNDTVKEEYLDGLQRCAKIMDEILKEIDDEN